MIYLVDGKGVIVVVTAEEPVRMTMIIAKMIVNDVVVKNVLERDVNHYYGYIRVNV
jgi:hypothetical protein